MKVVFIAGEFDRHLSEFVRAAGQLCKSLVDVAEFEVTLGKLGDHRRPVFVVRAAHAIDKPAYR